MSRAGKSRAAIQLALAAYWLRGATPDRLARFRSVIKNDDDEGEARWVIGAQRDPVGAAADPLVASFRSVADRRARGWHEIAAALGPAAGAFASALAADAKPQPVEPRDPGYAESPASTASFDLLYVIPRTTCLRALARIGPAAAAVLGDVDALRKDPDPRIAVLAARASRAIRRK